MSSARYKRDIHDLGDSRDGLLKLRPVRRRSAELKRQTEAQRREISALKKKDAQIDALAERMSAFEQQARTPKLQHLASTMP